MVDNSTNIYDNSTESNPVSPVNTLTIAAHNTASSHIIAYIFVPLGSLILVALLAIIAVFVFRKSRLDRLRHHLMPLYSFDPGEDDGDWESELLEDQDREQDVALRIDSPGSSSSSSKLNFIKPSRR